MTRVCAYTAHASLYLILNGTASTPVPYFRLARSGRGKVTLDYFHILGRSGLSQGHLRPRLLEYWYDILAFLNKLQMCWFNSAGPALSLNTIFVCVLSYITLVISYFSRSPIREWDKNILQFLSPSSILLSFPKMTVSNGNHKLLQFLNAS